MAFEREPGENNQNFNLTIKFIFCFGPSWNTWKVIFPYCSIFLFLRFLETNEQIRLCCSLSSNLLGLHDNIERIQ